MEVELFPKGSSTITAPHKPHSLPCFSSLTALQGTHSSWCQLLSSPFSLLEQFVLLLPNISAEEIRAQLW